MRAVPFKQVDVFTDHPFRGNPVAVILDAEGLDGEAMQAIARWTNLSETSFVLPPDRPGASYRLRIFTPRQELPFAGHPSVGTAAAVLEAGLAAPVDGRLLQSCAAGLLPLQVEDGPDGRRIHVQAPPARFAGVVDGDGGRLAAVLGATPLGTPAPQVVDNGPHWWVCGFAEAATLRGLAPDMGALAGLLLERGAVGVAAYAPEAGDGWQLAVRCFCPADGIPEDPVTGSGNAAIAAFLHRHGRTPAPTWTASQGREVGRDGRLQLQVDADGAVWVGGRSLTVVDGMVRLG